MATAGIETGPDPCAKNPEQSPEADAAWMDAIKAGLGWYITIPFTPDEAKMRIWESTRRIIELEGRKPNLKEALARLLVPAVRLLDWVDTVAAGAIATWSEAILTRRWIDQQRRDRDERNFLHTARRIGHILNPPKE
jgi:hypothetical protein